MKNQITITVEDYDNAFKEASSRLSEELAHACIETGTQNLDMGRLAGAVGMSVAFAKILKAVLFETEEEETNGNQNV